MSQIRARLAALRARREQQASQHPPVVRAPVSAHTAPARHDWRTQARLAADQRFRRTVVQSGVYHVLTKALPAEKDDIEQQCKSKRREAEEAQREEQHNHGGNDEGDQYPAGEKDDLLDREDDQDEEEAALEQVQQSGESLLPYDQDDSRATVDHSNLAANKSLQNTNRSSLSAEDSRSGIHGCHPKPAVTTPAEPDADRTDIDSSATTQEPSPDLSTPNDANMQNQSASGFAETGPIQSSEESEAQPETSPDAKSLKAQSDTVQYNDTSSNAKAKLPNTLGLVEDEAEDDGAENVQQTFHSGDSDDDSDCDIVADEDAPAGDFAALAEFHRKWEANQDAEPSTARVDDNDDAMDFTDVKGAVAEEDGISVEGGAALHDENASNYIDAMFLREDSKSRILDEQEDLRLEHADNSAKRDKARKLWKARQKFRAQLRERDEKNSLSLFDLFKDSESRSADIRARLEDACRAAPLRDMASEKEKKRKWEPPEWTRRQEIQAQKDRKRSRGVAMGNWSFAMHGRREKKEVKKTASARTSLGPAHLSKRARTREPATPPRVTPARPNAQPRRAGSTSFRGLLSVLGKQASADLSKISQ